MKIYNVLKTIRQEINNFLNDRYSKRPVYLDNKEADILQGVLDKGFYIIPDFYSTSWCNDLRKNIDVLIEKYKDQLTKDKQDSDHRIHGADRVSPLIEKFFKNELIDRVVKAHERTENVVGFTLAARLEYKPGNLGSGGGWHRDWAVDKQIKAIVYLSDVSEKGGPFQYIEGSHRHLNIVKEMFLNNFKFNQNRFTEEEANGIIKRNPNNLKTITGKSGTLILVNTRGIHRGMPIQKGVRYALTNYYWSNMQIPAHLAKIMIRN